MNEEKITNTLPTEEKSPNTTEMAVIRKKKKDRRYLMNVIIILLITFGYTTYSLWGDADKVIKVFQDNNADYRYLIVIALLIAAKYFIEGIILFIFARLYTNTYKVHRGIATGLVGQFYSDITPSSSGGHFFQVATFSKQGVPPAIAASILVMHFILYQIVLVIFGVVAILTDLNTFIDSGTVQIFSFNFPVWVITIIGFVMNLLTLLFLFLLSYSKKAHDLFINKGIDFLAKLRIVKKPEERKEKLRISTENFRVELRRLNANVPASIIIMVLFVLKLIVYYSVAYFVALMLDPSMAGNLSYISTVAKASFVSMTTGFIPTPGAAGFSEYFFELIFKPAFSAHANPSVFTKAVQIVWRFSTFYTNLIIGGLVAAFYRSSMENFIEESGETKTIQQIQAATMEERRATSVTMYQTSQLSIKEIQRRLTPKKKRKNEDEGEE